MLHDPSDKIRCKALKILADWVDTFADPSCHAAWTPGKQQDDKGQAIEYKVKWRHDTAGKEFGEFCEGKTGMLCERTLDLDEATATAAIELLGLSPFAEGMLDDQHVDAVVNLVANGKTLPIRLAAAEFIDRHIFTWPGVKDKTADPGTEEAAFFESLGHSETLLYMFLEYAEVYCRTALSMLHRVVECFWGHVGGIFGGTRCRRGLFFGPVDNGTSHDYGLSCWKMSMGRTRMVVV